MTVTAVLLTMYVCLNLGLCFSVFINALSKIRNNQPQKLLLKTLKCNIIIHILLVLGDQQIARISVRGTAFIFVP
jgi:hypothetical protein